jgi:hypothetical protein
MVPEKGIPSLFKPSLKHANIDGKLLKAAPPMHPESSDPQTGIPGHQAASAWYEEGELGICPECGQQTLLPPSEMAEPTPICLTCGVLSVPRKDSFAPGL